MRLLVFFDLPVMSKVQRKQATKFRMHLIKDGFYMIQFSLYGRIWNTIENAKMHEDRMKPFVPQSGSVRTMIVTEKQYASMNILIGVQKKKERKISTEQISFF